MYKTGMDSIDRLSDGFHGVLEELSETESSEGMCE
jgi:hypothetical protein